MVHALRLSFPALVAIAVSCAPAIAQDVAKGRQAFGACAACHSGAPGAIGPTLNGIVGRRAAAVPGYRYSPALQRSGLTWDAATLRRFLINPQGTIPGNRMPYGGAAPADADALVKYLATLK